MGGFMKYNKLMDKKIYLSNAAIEEIKKSYEIYLNSFQNKIYKISFDDNTNISFAIRDMNLPHLLGINTTLGIYKILVKSLKEDGLYTSYDLMMYMMNNKEKFMTSTKKDNLPIDYNNIIKKCRCFNNFENLASLNFIGMDIVNPIKPLKSNNFIITENPHEYFDYSLLGIKNVRSQTYSETIIPASRGDIFFKEQKFKIPEKIEIREKETIIENIITIQNKQQLLKKYRDLLEKDTEKKLIKEA